MIIVMESNASTKQLVAVIEKVRALGLSVHINEGVEQIVLGVIGDTTSIETSVFASIPGVARVERVTAPYKLVSRHPANGSQIMRADTKVCIGEVEIGGNEVVVIAGPCAVEGKDWLLRIAGHVKQAGAVILRGGAFKPRTGPYSFEGLGVQGLKMLAEARRETGLPIVTEVMAIWQLKEAVKYDVDVLQIGARNMQNFELLKKVGHEQRPVLLKRGMSATIEEFLLAAEYILKMGNPNVILCPRGIRTFEQTMRNTPDISAIAVLKQLTHLPVCFDPSHSTGRREMVAPMAMAAVATGADALIIEVNDEPEKAKCDGAQSLLPEQFDKLMGDLQKIAGAIGRKILLPATS